MQTTIPNRPPRGVHAISRLLTWLRDPYEHEKTRKGYRAELDSIYGEMFDIKQSTVPIFSELPDQDN